MGRYKQAPVDFECPYRKRCPHMGGISAMWALSTFHDAGVERNEHWRIREMMAREIDDGLARIAQLEAAADADDPKSALLGIDPDNPR